MAIDKRITSRGERKQQELKRSTVANNEVFTDPELYVTSSSPEMLDYTTERDVDYYIQFNRYEYVRLINTANFPTETRTPLASSNTQSVISKVTNFSPNIQNIISRIRLPLLTSVRHSYNGNFESFRAGIGAEGVLDFVSGSFAQGGTQIAESITAELKNRMAFGVENRGIANNELAATTNPREETSFIGMGNRTHAFEFTLIPRNQKENEIITEIIRELKIAMHPETKGFTDETNGFLKFPDEFTIGFYSRATGQPLDIPPIPDCFLTGFSVDYNANNQARFFNDNKAMSYRISLQFTEANVLTRNEIIAGGF